MDTYPMKDKTQQKFGKQIVIQHIGILTINT